MSADSPTPVKRMAQAASIAMNLYARFREVVGVTRPRPMVNLFIWFFPKIAVGATRLWLESVEHITRTDEIVGERKNRSENGEFRMCWDSVRAAIGRLGG